MSWPPDRINLTCHSDSHHTIMPVCRSTMPEGGFNPNKLVPGGEAPRVTCRFTEPITELMWHQKQNPNLACGVLNWSSYYGTLYKYHSNFNRYKLIFWGESATCQILIHWNGDKVDVAQRNKIASLHGKRWTCHDTIVLLWQTAQVYAQQLGSQRKY